LGDIITVGEEYNNYYKGLAISGDPYLSGQPNRQILNVIAALKKYFAGTMTVRTEDIEELCDNIPAIINLAMDGLRFSTLVSREAILELTRVVDFPTYPSRFKGIWLIPDDPEALHYWKNTLRIKPGAKLYRVKANGVGHRGNTSYPIFNNECYPIDEYRQHALKYWRGEGTPSPFDEVIFTGTIEVMEELPMDREE
jgi:hypothetical protein